MPLPTDSPKSSPGKKIRQLPAKLGRKIKRQLSKISTIGHVPYSVFITSPHPRCPSTPISPSASSRTAYSRPSAVGTDSSRHNIESLDSLTCFEQSSVLSMDNPTSMHKKPVASTSRTDIVSEPASEPVVEDSVEQASPHETAYSEVPTFPAPAVYVEPDVPDPFLVDDDASSDEEVVADDTAPSSQSTATHTPIEVPLTLSPFAEIVRSPTSHTTDLPSPNVNKSMPPLPADSETDEDEAPDLYLPGLLLPTMFLPIPNTDPLTILLTKYIYPPEKRPVRDVTGDWQRSDFHTLVMTNSWRALARMARDRLVAANPEDITLILGLWYLRLACLARLRLFNQAAAECDNLFVVLNAIEPLDAREWVFSRVLPFELEVIHARVKYWAGDYMGHLDALNVLLHKCRTKARQEKGNEDAVSMWKERGARVCLIIASQLVEMKEYRAAVKLLEPLCEQGESSTAALRSSIGRIYLESGEVQAAVKHFEIIFADPSAAQELKDMNAGLLACAEGDWGRASSLFEASITRDANNFVAVNNLAVALLGQGKLKEGIDVLEAALKTSPSSVVVAEPFLFNLSTLYELHSGTAAENKRTLLLEVAKWSGDGLRTTCLKMPTN